MNNIPSSHTRFIVSCVSILGGLCVIAGTWITYKGYNAELLFGGGVGAITGLLGMLSTRPTPPPDVTISGQPPKVEVTQPTTEKPKL